ncbi:hypothetical protein FB451DRAFT_1270969 [Mycena latifolia]|nr:hypothetical protein FB451DRAFT_1270969 [Mycena latifolia]
MEQNPDVSFSRILPNAPQRVQPEIGGLQADLAQTVSEPSSDNGTEAYVEGCISSLPPIYLLPAELLINIFFHLCPPFPGSPSQSAALDRLRNADILHSAQVCSYWHGIAMGTTALWSTIVVESHVGCTPDQTRNFVGLSLQRSGTSPLTIMVGGEPDPTVLELLGQHSRRWRNVCLSLPPSSVHILRGVKDNLPLLQHLYIYGTAGRDLDLFATAPKLEAISCELPAEELPSALPWVQLKTFEYVYGIPEDLPDLWHTMTRLSIGTEVNLDLEFEVSVPLDLIQITSNVASLSLHFTCPDPGDSAQVFSEIMKHITFPHMFELCLFSGIGAPDLAWPHHEFLSFASRSSFSTNLTALQLNVVKIPEIELLEVLSVLRALERLTLVDDDGEAGPTLISSELLRRLIYTPEPGCLVPALKSLVLGTLLHFDEHTYLEFIVSRLSPSRRFRSDLLWLPGHERELCAEVCAKLEQFVRRRELWFVMKADVL